MRIKYFIIAITIQFILLSIVISHKSFASSVGLCTTSNQLSMLIAQSAACVTAGGYCSPGVNAFCTNGELTQYSSSCTVNGITGKCCSSNPQPGVAAPTIPPLNTPVPTAVTSNGMSSSACYSINQGTGPGQCYNSCPTGWAPQGSCNFGGTTCCVPSNTNNGGTASSCGSIATCSFSPSCPANSYPVGGNGPATCTYNGQYTGLCCNTNQPSPNPPPNPIPTSIQNTPAPTCPPGVLFCNGKTVTPTQVLPAPTCPPGVLFCNGKTVTPTQVLPAPTLTPLEKCNNSCTPLSGNQSGCYASCTSTYGPTATPTFTPITPITGSPLASANAPVVINPCDDPSLNGVAAVCANGSTPEYSIGTGVHCNGSTVYLCFTNILKIKSPFSNF